jgi:hypothetical protein
MYTDAETGVIVKLLGYNENGALSHFVNTLDLKFEDDAEPFEMPDLSAYQMHEMQEPAFAEEVNGVPDPEAFADEPVRDMDS